MGLNMVTNIMNVKVERDLSEVSVVHLIIGV